MSWITTALTTLWTVVTQCVQFIVGGGATGTVLENGNPLLQVFLAAGLVAIGFRIFRSAKKAARK